MSQQIYAAHNSHSLFIGIGKRKTDPDALNITAKDAELLGKVFIENYNFRSENVTCITNELADDIGIINSLKELVVKTQKNNADLVIIYFSGHGCKVNGKLFFICNNTLNEDIESSAIEGEIFLEYLNKINTDKMLLLLNCCHSGAFEKNSISIPFNKEDLLTKTNRVILTSCGSEELSYISYPVSLFTYSLLEGLAGKQLKGNNQVTIFDLSMYVHERVLSLSKRKQTPQLDCLEQSLINNFILTQPEPLLFLNLPHIKLENGDGLNIDTNDNVQTDVEFRNKFLWIKNNTISIIGDGNISYINQDGRDQIININTSSDELKIFIASISHQFEKLIFLLESQKVDRYTELGIKMTKANQLENFKKEINHDLDTLGSSGLANVFEKIINSPFTYNKGSFANLRNDSYENYALMNENKFLIRVRLFLQTLR